MKVAARLGRCTAGALGAWIALAAVARAQTIDTIVVESANVFDDDRNIAARWANALHITTSPWVIRRAILERPGEPYDSARAAESARNLRALGVFRTATIDTTRMDDRLALRVRTADGWSSKPIAAISSTDGSTAWILGFREENLIGSATTFGFAYRRTPDRDGYELEFVNPQFVARGLLVDVRYRRFSDGRRAEWAGGKPFREGRSAWSAVTYGVDGRERMLVYRDGLLDASYRRTQAIVGARGGVALKTGSRGFVRAWMDGMWRREDYTADTATVMPRSTFAAVGLGVEAARLRLTVIRHWNSFGRPEDVDLSTVLRLGVWLAPRAFGYPDSSAGAGPEVSVQVGFPWSGGFGVLRAAGRGIIGPAGLDSGRTSASLLLATQALPRQTLVFFVEGAAAANPAPGGEYDLWLLERGPRLFGIHAFSGTRFAWGTAESRVVISPEWLGLVGLGVAPFVDYGGAWYADQSPRTGGNAGLALRFGSTRSVGGGVFELAGGYRFGEGFAGGPWAATFRSGLRF